MAYNAKDYYYQKAKKENFAARSIFKLEEIDQRFRLIKSGDKIMDLGAAPGSWSQYCAQKVGVKGRVLGVDLQSIQLTLPNAYFLVGDMRSIEWTPVLAASGLTPPFDGVLSDMAPKTTGIRITDQARSMELCMIALETARKYLKVGGYFVVKFFHSDEFKELEGAMKQSFEKVEVLRPKSTRKESKEVFLIGLRKRNEEKGEKV